MSQNIELFTHVLSGITIILYQTKSQNTGQSG